MQLAQLATMGMSTAAQVAAPLMQGSSAASALKLNATQAEIERDEILRQADAQAGEIGAQGASFVGRQRAAMAGAGLDVGAPSAMDVMLDSIRTASAESLAVRRKAAWAARAKTFEADVYRKQASRSLLAGWIQATSALTSGVGKGLEIAGMGGGTPTPAPGMSGYGQYGAW